MTFDKFSNVSIKGVRVFPVISLIITNVLLATIGAFSLDWDGPQIVLAFWTESLVVGIFTLLKMNLMPDEDAFIDSINNGVTTKLVGPAAKKVLSNFFMIHFGFFMLVHFIFLVILLAVSGADFFGDFGEYLVAMVMGFVFLSISHGVSFVTNFRRDIKTEHIGDIFISPYKRIVPMHIAILIGAPIAGALGGDAGMVFVLLGVKLIVDVYSHVVEHRVKKNLPAGVAGGR